MHNFNQTLSVTDLENHTGWRHPLSAWHYPIKVLNGTAENNIIAVPADVKVFNQYSGYT